MKLIRHSCLIVLALLFTASNAWADKYQNTIDVFKNAGQSSSFFKHSYGYAVFPLITKMGMIVGGSGGNGRVYRQGRYIGDTLALQISVGFQLGAQGFSQIIFFEKQSDLEKFTSGSFEFGIHASAVLITAGATAAASTSGNSAGISGGHKNATTTGEYIDGMATFTVTIGGLMYETAVAGQKFSFTPLPQS